LLGDVKKLATSHLPSWTQWGRKMLDLELIEGLLVATIRRIAQFVYILDQQFTDVNQAL
jgi:hypothetical protein